MSEDWTKEWERRVVNGVYPLRRFLGQSNHSAVFLTECQAQNIAQAAIKILPAYPELTEAQLSYWKQAATLSHPHLIRLLDSGRCQLGGHEFLFVVMDYAEQNLAQILPGRPLTPGEVRDILPPTLDALAYLHSKNLVQGGLKPPNFLVVNDQLKLASDTIRRAGERSASNAKLSLYDPPEAQGGSTSTAGDIWGLGITLIEALTQAPPAWARDTSAPVALPPNLAPEFVDKVQRCLSRDPALRATLAEIGGLSKEPPPAPPESASPPIVETKTVASTISTGRPSKRRLFVGAIALAVVAVWAGWAVFHRASTRSTAKVAAAIAPRPQPPISPPALENPKPNIATLPTILHQEMPEISRSARASIRGVIKVPVRVTIDPSGNVVAAVLDSRGSSRYFARTATDAAKKWKFAPDAEQTSRVWLLQFEVTRAGAAAHATALR